MGNTLSLLLGTERFGTCSSKLSIAKRRLYKLIRQSWWFSGWTVWAAMTGSVVLLVPVLFEFERECQFFDQVHQMQQAQLASSSAPGSL